MAGSTKPNIGTETFFSTNNYGQLFGGPAKLSGMTHDTQTLDVSLLSRVWPPKVVRMLLNFSAHGPLPSRHIIFYRSVIVGSFTPKDTVRNYKFTEALGHIRPAVRGGALRCRQRAPFHSRAPCSLCGAVRGYAASAIRSWCKQDIAGLRYRRPPIRKTCSAKRNRDICPRTCAGVSGVERSDTSSFETSLSRHIRLPFIQIEIRCPKQYKHLLSCQFAWKFRLGDYRLMDWPNIILPLTSPTLL